MKNGYRPLLISGIIVLVLVGFLINHGPDSGSASTLTVYCAAGMKLPVEEIAKQYEEDFGVQVRLEYGGSGTLLSSIQIAKTGDIYLAADTSYIDIAREKGLVSESIPTASIKPVIAVPKGNPRGLTGIEALLEEDIRVSLGNPDAASVGRTTKKLLTESGHWNSLEAQVRDHGVFKPTVNEVANDVKLGTVDAGIVWDATTRQYSELDLISLPNADTFVKSVTSGILSFSKNPTAALRFARYMAASDKGLPIFEKHGFETIDGDLWAVRPEIVYFAGGVNRVAIEKTLAAFGEREGIEITTVYNGCGILLGSIKGGERPDVYHTCDASFMKGVENLFGDADAVSKTDIMLLTQPGNPHDLHRLEDLTKAGLQVGLCNEDQSTLGFMTGAMLRDKGIYDAVQKNVIVNTPTADLLVAQVTVGKLDAAVVYRANTLAVGDKAEVLSLPDDNANATQTYAIGEGTKYPQLLTRLQETIRSATSKQQFETSGFEFLEKKL
jgi:molybdate transport system substrate-binding protein